MSWVYEHYLYYLCLCIADTDCLVSDKDTVKIKQEVFKNIDPSRFSLLQKEVYQEFIIHSEKERMEFINENASRYLRTAAIRQRVISQLGEFAGDESENNPAWIMFRFIRKVINNLK